MPVFLSVAVLSRWWIVRLHRG